VTGSFSPVGIATAPKADFQKYSMTGKIIQIYTLQGKLVAQKQIETENCLNGKSMLYKNLSKGTYIVHIPTDNAVLTRRVLVE